MINLYNDFLASLDPLEAESYHMAMMLADKNNEYKQYLKDTDWYVTRLTETGTPIPGDVIQKRQEARENI